MYLYTVAVPPGFTLTTDVCTEYYKNNKSFPESLTEEVKESLSKVESIMGTKFGDPSLPPFSLPFAPPFAPPSFPLFLPPSQDSVLILPLYNNIASAPSIVGAF